MLKRDHLLREAGAWFPAWMSLGVKQSNLALAVRRPKLIVLGGLWCLACWWVPLSAEEQQATANAIDSHDAADDKELNQQVRSILSNRCFACHGPDEEERQGGFRLDQRESFLAEADTGFSPVVPGKPEESELLRRITSAEQWERMPPPDFGGKLSESETELIEEWIRRGAELPRHWSFVAPERPALPSAGRLSSVAKQLSAEASGSNVQGLDVTRWLEHPIDRFVLRQQVARGMLPSPAATREELLRRVSLDLTGLPPTPDQVQRFVQDESPEAYRRQVERLLASPAYGEHWARKWLDLARYADSAGYADDPPRTIWAYRDWVVRAHNENMPIDQFTIEQLAGDLLPNPTQQQLVATAFHRNTLTNNEGGTNDEEFRNVAIVDRVNTTMAVWMGVTMACAQCHTHKYDPFTQEEYFQLFAILNQTQDADRRDERPVLDLFTAEQRFSRLQWLARQRELESQLMNRTEAIAEEAAAWEAELQPPRWSILQPKQVSSQQLNEQGGRLTVDAVGEIRANAGQQLPDSDTFLIDVVLDSGSDSLPIAALRLQTLPQEDWPGEGAGLGNGNFVLSDLRAKLIPRDNREITARYIRIELPGDQKILSLAEVQAWSGTRNVALDGTASQSSVDYSGVAQRAIDGDITGDFEQNSVTHTKQGSDPWWEVDLGRPQNLDRLTIWNRTGGNLHQRLSGAMVKLLDANRQPLWEKRIEQAPALEVNFDVQQTIPVRFEKAYADYSQSGFPASAAIDSDPRSGWAVGGAVAKSHRLTLVPSQPIRTEEPSLLRLELDFRSPYPQHVLGAFRLQASGSPSAGLWASLSPSQRQMLTTHVEQRPPGQQAEWLNYFARNLAGSTREIRKELQELSTKLSSLKPQTSVPILRELPKSEHRETFVQIRGNYKSLGKQVQPGTPQVFHPVRYRAADAARLANKSAAPQAGRRSTHDQPSASKDAPESHQRDLLVSTRAEQRLPDRLDLAYWLVDRRNPLTARVWMNRLWESLFGIGIVRSSEEFGSQGDRPSHPQLLDWLAVEFMDSGWDQKQMLRRIVLSQTYQQSSQVSRGDLQRDADNIWLARGPRVRLTAEMVRDQALFVSGLLSEKMYGKPVRPPQPDLGLKAAFGGKTDWEPSRGADRYRRGLYTTWRRSSPYPSMATFDAPSREVCTLKRDRTNTPLQALVTLNDPGFVEAAQGLGRRVVCRELPDVGDDQRLRRAFQLCTSRQPTKKEVEQLASLLEEARGHFRQRPEAARQLATEPLGPLPEGADPIEMAAWTAVGNVLLNLDEVLMKR